MFKNDDPGRLRKKIVENDEYSYEFTKFVKDALPIHKLDKNINQQH